MISTAEVPDVRTGQQSETSEVPTIEYKHTIQPEQEAFDETLYLIGRPTLSAFLNFVKRHGVHPPSEKSLTEEWQAAQRVLSSLEQEEAGFADNPTITKLDTKKYESLLVEFLKDPLVQDGFNTVPTEVAIVELDRMVVYQHHIDLTYIRRLERELGEAPDDEQIFEMSLLHKHPQALVKSARLHKNSFVIMSMSNDLRYLGTMKLKPENIIDYPKPGNLAEIFGIAVGFGSNFLNAIYAQNRLILHNGYHRAFALRKAGVTHAPCIIQHASSKEEINAVVSSEVAEHLDYYFKYPRPSMFKDFFDRRLHTIVPTHRRAKQIIVKFDIDDGYVPAL